MLDAVRSMGGEVDAIFFCPHRPEDGCHCRKPLPGLFEEIAERLKVNLSGAYAVGDCERDIQAARAVSAQPVLVRTGKGKHTLKGSTAEMDLPIFNDLADFTTALLAGTI
jgi:D-glycero-D-manno-heptose 1,7-bisphosphate phosphatase